MANKKNLKYLKKSIKKEIKILTIFRKRLHKTMPKKLDWVCKYFRNHDCNWTICEDYVHEAHQNCVDCKMWLTGPHTWI